jgi:GrpB-like predicted nucleotidyltransferase (UPF0157 family)
LQQRYALISFEERLREVTIGEPTLHNDRITLVEYDAQWPAMFQHERDQIAQTLGERALRIEHVGSTSVPGLVAKPVIDIALEVPDSADEAAYVPALESSGYTLRVREPKWHEHRLFKGPRIEINLHTFSAGCPEIQRMLAFRDRLRSDAADRAIYASAKRTLAQRRWQYIQEYADAKSAVVETILARAAANYRTNSSPDG